MEYNWDFHMIFAGYEAWWLKGLLITLAYASATVFGGLVIGVLCGMGLLANRWWLSGPIHIYVEVFRCTPVLVQIVWFFFALPILLDAVVPGGRIEPAGLAGGGDRPHPLHGVLRHRDLSRRHHLHRQGAMAGGTRHRHDLRRDDVAHHPAPGGAADGPRRS